MRTFKQYLTVGIFALWGASANADIVSDVARVEGLDALNTKEFVSTVLYLGERNPRFELAQNLRPRLDALNLRAAYPDAWRLYSQREISEFSYFGFKMRQVEEGSLPLEKFLRELQQAIERWK